MAATSPLGDVHDRAHATARGRQDRQPQGPVRRRLGRDFAAGTERLYEWLDGNQDVAFLPVEIVNSPDVIARNREMVTINGAMAIDIQGQVIADTINGTQYSRIGGHEDFDLGRRCRLRRSRCSASPRPSRWAASPSRGSSRGSRPAP